MKKILFIIAIILFIVAVITGILWLRARKHVANQGGTPLSFRTFLTQGDPTRTSSSSGGGTLFPNQGNGSNEGSGGTGLQQPGIPGAPGVPTHGIPGAPGTPEMPSASGIAVSEFTSGPITPTQGPGIGLPGSPTSPGAPGIPGIITSGVTQVVSPLPGTPAAPTSPSTPGTATQGSGSACSDADLYIAFTAQELERLGQLQQQFIAIADTLRTDGDVDAEEANYTTFAAKSAQIAELYNYCQAKAPLIQSDLYQRRVATPFWRDAQHDKTGYINFVAGNISGEPLAGSQDSRVIIERLLHISLW
ncbi:hypothetical protein IT401_02460 [Candidatus Nomurabacteria bacterium]|nr:hypothetical protein [Candidatus Nomurabacteria bacterium]